MGRWEWGDDWNNGVLEWWNSGRPPAPTQHTDVPLFHRSRAGSAELQAEKAARLGKDVKRMIQDLERTEVRQGMLEDERLRRIHQVLGRLEKARRD
jgi:hypothetical protein